MRIKAIVIVLGFVVAGALALESGPGLGSGRAEAAPARSQSKAKKTRQARRSTSKRKGKRKVCSRSNGKRRCSWQATFQGHGAPDALRSDPVPRPSGEIWLFAENFGEEVKVNIYGESGDFDEEALAQLDTLFRCKRSGETRAIDPRLYELLSVIYDNYGQQRIVLISGFRQKPDQETSRHFHGSAMDIRVPGVSTRKLYDFASSLDTGGMGVGRYPVSDFVHVDLRAPGEKSYRWTDYSGPDGSGKSKKKRSTPRDSRRNRPNA